MTLTVRRVAVWLAVVIGICWIGGVTGGFHFDDSHSVETNLAVRSLRNIPSFWTDPKTSSFIPENRVYRPLVYTFYSFCWLFGGGSTVPFHFMKMMMHFLVCLSLFLIWRRLWKQPGWYPIGGLKLQLPLFSQSIAVTHEWAAFFLAILFAIHPACSECVDYISATTSLQCAMFYLWAYYCYLLWRDSDDLKYLGWGLGLYFCSVASKEEGITLPAMIFVTELFLLNHRFSDRVVRAIKRMIPFAGLACVLAFWIYLMHPESGNESRGVVSPLHYFITQWRAYLWYMRLWFWPWDLNADNASLEFSQSITAPLVIQAAIGNLFILGTAWALRKRYPSLLFGMLWFYITIAPASSVVVLAEAINEHRMYLSYVGFVGGTFVLVLAFADWFFKSEARAKRVGLAYALIAIGFFVGAQERNRVWRNDENLWADTVEKNPTSGRALNNLALVYMARGEYDPAIALLDKCEQYWGTYMYCALNKGVAFSSMGQIADNSGKKDLAATDYNLAEKSLQRAYSLNPHSVHVNFHLARFYEDVRKDFSRAIPYYSASVEGTGGRYPAADIHLATCYSHSHQYDEARTSLRRALGVEPDNQFALFELGRLEFDAGKSDDSIGAYLHLLSLNPNHVQAWYNYGVVVMAKQDYKTAQQAFENTVKLDPKSEQGWFNFAYASEHLGDGDKAVGAAQELVKLAPGRPEFENRLRDLEKKFRKSQHA